MDKLKRYTLMNEWNKDVLVEDINGTYTHWYSAHQELATLQTENAELKIQVTGWKYNWKESTDREIGLNKEIERLNKLLNAVEAENARLRNAIQRAIDDQESGTGWGPDITVCGYLRDALMPNVKVSGCLPNNEKGSV